MMWTDKMWWKYIGIILLAYAFLFGLAVPLGSGISASSTTKLNSENAFSVKLKTHNLQTANTNVTAYLKFSNTQYVICGDFALDQEEVLVSCNLSEKPKDLPVRNSAVSLILVGDEKDVAILPKFYFVDFTGLKEGTLETIHTISGIKEGGFHFPFRNILLETIRNLFYHVSLWFGMVILAAMSLFYAVRFLRKSDKEDDLKVYALITVVFLFGVLGLLTGSVWAKSTWGSFWTTDVKLNMSAIVVMMYGAYLLLRNAIRDEDKMRKTSAAYAIFCFVAMIPLIFVVPRLQDSLHPGNGGNPGLGGEDLDGTMRLIFYPAVIGMTLTGLWLSNIYFRMLRIRLRRQMR